jgi:hypothetical protein
MAATRLLADNANAHTGGYRMSCDHRAATIRNEQNMPCGLVVLQ